MSHKKNRELVVLRSSEGLSEAALERELEQLHSLLYCVEELEAFCRAHEVHDLNRYKVYTQSGRVKKVVLRRDFKAFEFLFNRN
ncbi:MAG: hypothetical protein ACK4E8_12980 [Lacibacter sp.]|jgi:hypothetical protein